MASLRTLRSNSLHTNSENAGPLGVTKMNMKSKGLRSGLNEINPNVKGNSQRVPLKEVMNKPLRASTRQTTKESNKNVLTTRSNNVATIKKSVPELSKPVDVKEDKMEVEEVHAVKPEQNVAEIKMCDVENIDADDKDNPLQVHEYVNEIHAYLKQLEVKLDVKPNFLENNKVIKPAMRNLLVDWLVDVHQQFSLLQETLFLTVALLDRYLQSECSKSLQRKELQLLGVTALFVASKYEEMYPPELGDFVYITDNAYNEKQILQMEITLLNALRFDLGKPLPINFLRRYSKAGCGMVDVETYALAKYVMELSIVEYAMAHIAPSQLAAASLVLAMQITDTEKNAWQKLWTPTLQYYSKYSVESLSEVVRQLSSIIVSLHQSENTMNDTPSAETPSAPKQNKKRLSAITKKYASKKFLRISEIPMLKDADLKFNLQF